MRYAFLLVIALAVLAACAPADDIQPETFTCPDGTEIPIDEECPQPEETPQEQETEPTQPEPETPSLQDTAFDRSAFDEVFGSTDQPTPPVGSNLEDIQARALQQTLDGYTYTYSVRSSEQGFQEPLYQSARVHLREGETAIKLADTTTRREIDTYINGVAYCTSCRPQPEPQEAQMPQVPQPLDLLLSLEDATEARSAQSIGGRQTIRLTATLNQQEAEVFIDQHSGLPVEIRQGAITHQFSSLVLSARDDAFRAPY